MERHALCSETHLSSTEPLLKNKLEINFYRLLRSCEKRAESMHPEMLAKDVKFYTFVTVLKEKLAEVVDDITPGGEILAKESEYRKRIAALEQKTNKQAMPDIWQPLHAPSGASESLSSPTPSSAVPLDSTLRRRAGASGGKGVGGGGDREQLQIDEESRQVMERNRNLQDDLTDELVGLAGGIKKNSLLIQDALKDSHKTLDQSQVSMEHNVLNTKIASRQASKAFRNSFCTGCMSWLVILGVFGAFLGMVVLIRIT